MRQKTIITKLLQSVTEVYYKVCQTVITKCVRYYKVWQAVITMRQVLQSATVITKWDVTSVYNIFTCGTLIILFLLHMWNTDNSVSSVNFSFIKNIYFTHWNNISYFVKVEKAKKWKGETCRFPELKIKLIILV